LGVLATHDPTLVKRLADSDPADLISFMDWLKGKSTGKPRGFFPFNKAGILADSP